MPIEVSFFFTDVSHGDSSASSAVMLATHDDDDDVTILMCAQKLTDASLIYRTEPELSLIHI